MRRPRPLLNLRSSLLLGVFLSGACDCRSRNGARPDPVQDATAPCNLSCSSGICGSECRTREFAIGRVVVGVGLSWPHLVIADRGFRWTGSAWSAVALPSPNCPQPLDVLGARTTPSTCCGSVDSPEFARRSAGASKAITRTRERCSLAVALVEPHFTMGRAGMGDVVRLKVRAKSPVATGSSFDSDFGVSWSRYAYPSPRWYASSVLQPFGS